MSPLRVLIVRVGAMGDVLHALPAVAALRRAVPEATLDWVVDERWAPLLSAGGESPVVSRVFHAETRLWARSPVSAQTMRSLQALRRALRTEAYDLVVDLQGTLRSAVIGRMARSPVRCGFADPRERLAGAFYNRALPRRGRHVVEQCAALLGDALQLSLAPVPPALPRDAAADAWAEQTLTGLGAIPAALLAPTAGWGAKEWPPAHFAALTRTLTDRGWAVLLNAAHPGDPIATLVAGLAGNAGAVRLVSPPVGGLLALTRRVRVVVGGDTGPVHLAAALGVPTVALFGPTDPARNGPWGAGPVITLRSPASVTSHKRIRAVDPGLAGLNPEEVVAAVDVALTDRSAKMQ